MTERLGQPFPEPSESAQNAYQNAAYVQVTHSVGLDHETGDLIFSSHNACDEKHGTVGELLTDSEMYIPGFNDEKSKYELAWMMGYLMAKLEAKIDTDGVQE